MDGKATIDLDPELVPEIRKALYNHIHRFTWDNGDGTMTEVDMRLTLAEEWGRRPESSSPLWAVLRLGGDRGIVVAIRHPLTG
jgi:hypothetical protein